MLSRYTDTLAVMQRGLITPQMRQAAVVGDLTEAEPADLACGETPADKTGCKRECGMER
jgi:hypothetical protein